MMTKIISFILAVFTAIYMFVSCGRLPGRGDEEPSTAPETSAAAQTEPVTSETNLETESKTEIETETETEAKPVSKTLRLYINGEEMPVTWENNESAAALAELSAQGMSVEMSRYGGFEQVGSLGASLPKNDKQTTASSGDIMLYQGNQIVIFYGSNSWAYTRLGHINLSRTEMTRLLSDSDAQISLKYE